MHVIVIGSGVIGAATAYHLRLKGLAVTVVDRQPGAARETSFANAGEVSPGYSSPWAAPGVPWKALRWAFQRDAPLVVHPRLDPSLMRWIAAFLPNCNAGAYRVNKLRMMRLAEYSRARLQSLRETLNLQYDHRTQGTLQLFGTARQLADSARDRRILDEAGVAYRLLDAQGCADVEPALGNSERPIAGGLHLPGDETGDCHLFTSELAREAVRLGVRFQFGAAVSEVLRQGKRITGIVANGERLTADSYVFATGSFTPRILRSIGLSLPIYPVKGYSLTATISDAARSPVSTVLDENCKVAITRLGDRVRIGGLAELAGYDLSLPPSRRRTLERSASSLFGGACDYSTAEFWTGLRPMTPDGPPLIGRLPLDNAFINAGHGTLGWTMGCGSAALLADILCGDKSQIDAAAYAPTRNPPPLR